MQWAIFMAIEHERYNNNIIAICVFYEEYCNRFVTGFTWRQHQFSFASFQWRLWRDQQTGNMPLQVQVYNKHRHAAWFMTYISSILWPLFHRHNVASPPGPNEFVRIPAGLASVGKPADFPSYGWDNEYGLEKLEWVNQYILSHGDCVNFSMKLVCEIWLNLLWIEFQILRRPSISCLTENSMNL